MIFIPSHPARSAAAAAAATKDATNKDQSDCVGIDVISTAVTSPHTIVLPPITSDDFVSQRHEANPALALSLLSDIQAKVVTWQQQQRQIVYAMRLLHTQGPMVDGWLQSSLEHTADGAASASATILRHGDADVLMQYVNALENSESGSTNSHSAHLSRSTSIEQKSQYCLCMLNDDGTVRSQICPPEQMAMVSTAIARYQKFKQLALQKQAIATKLQQAVDLLTGLRATLQQD